MNPPVRNLLPPMRARLEEASVRFDVHCHLFTRDYIPDNYLHVRLPWLLKRNTLRRIIRLLQGRRKDDDTWTQHATDFMEVAGKGSVKAVADELLGQSDPDTVFCPLMMDMTQAFGPGPVKDMHHQLDAMREARNAHPDRLLPFVALDPNNPDMELLFEKAFSDEYAFFGVKIYPVLGYLPSHPRLMNVFEQCERLGIPVTTHCGGHSTRAVGSVFDLPFRLYDAAGQPVDEVQTQSFDNENDKGRFFNDPAHWKPALERFPNLRLNLAHFGGDEEWIRFAASKPDTWVHRIVELMEHYPNVYADVSFLLHLVEKPNLGFLRAFEELAREKELVSCRTLYGSDYYMVLIHEKLPLVEQNFRIRLDDALTEKLTRTNPRRFLGL